MNTDSPADVSKFTKEQAAKWLGDLGQAVSGTKEELITRINKFIKYPKLTNKLRLKAKRNYSFPCSLDPLSIPPPSKAWKSNGDFFPKVTQEIYSHYLSHKNEGSKGQQEKAHRMLQSRKIVSVVVLHDNDNVYVKAMVLKSYNGTLSRPAVILFNNKSPKKAHCSCPVGASGLCCHVIALLLFLMHFNKTQEKILQLTCTEQLQKWHKRSKKGSIPMVPLTAKNEKISISFLIGNSIRKF